MLEGKKLSVCRSGNHYHDPRQVITSDHRGYDLIDNSFSYSKLTEVFA
jgi:hypothetical protein